MVIKEKAELRKQFASRINNNSEGMIAGISSDWRDLTFVYDIPFDNEKIDDESKDYTQKAQLWVVFIFDDREPSGCRVLIEQHWLLATESKHLLTFSIDSKDVDDMIPNKYSNEIRKIVQWVRESYNEVISSK